MAFLIIPPKPSIASIKDREKCNNQRNIELQL